MNKVILIGNLTRDPEGGAAQSGVSWCRFSLAVDRYYTGHNGEKQVDYLNVVAWRSTADNCLLYLKRGAKVAVSGRIETRQYDGENGQRRYVTEIMAESVEFLGTKAGGDSQHGEDN